MVVRLTRLHIPPEKVKQAKKLYQKELVPEVKKQKGNIDIMLLEPTDDTNDYISFTAWETDEDAENYETSGKYKQMVDKFKDMFTGKTDLKTYKAR